MFEDISIAISNIGKMLLYDQGSPMIFSSGLFWLLFLIFIPIYAAVQNNRTRMVLFVSAFSLYFYYKSSGIFFLLLIATSLVDWVISRFIYHTQTPWKRKALMWISICLSLSILSYFKYINFFGNIWNQIVINNFQPMEIILPVGISFYTFQSISYVVDVYKKRIRPTGNWLDYFFFLSFFPALVAGPIVRADVFIPQIRQNRRATGINIYSGLWLIIIGIVKKAIIADYIAQYNDGVFQYPGAEGFLGLQSLMGVLGYTFQIYCDFSGYSDMAIGIALIMGFKLGINFNFPYKSRNVSDFWRRWHISLSSWLRDYVYIPLGGNRKGKIRTYVNNFLTMLIGGLWHGAAWKFIYWGAMHGIGLIIHKLCKPWLKKVPDNFLTKSIFWAITFCFIAASMTLFRANSVADAITILKSIFINFRISHLPQFFDAQPVWCIMMLILIVGHTIPEAWADKCRLTFIKAPWIIKLLIFLIVVQFVIIYMSAEVAPFIYFQF
ncbi:MAG: MBOAT family protein [Prevotella sp.]|nr:MBOAT family protein [Prevotella sp.]MCM1074683.1 MBOAT family protein [Ruminococcus sp.]